MDEEERSTTTVRRRTGHVSLCKHRTALASPIRLDGSALPCCPDLTLLRALRRLDPDTREHLRRVSELAGQLASVLGLARDAQRQGAVAGLFHDIGKSLVPRSILHKPTPLSPDEIEVLRLHPLDGQALACVISDAVVLDAIRHHHERLDGTGYPDGLSADGLAEVTRVVAVADMYDALTSDRPYRAALSAAEAFRLMTDVAGTKLDPEMVQALGLLQTDVLSPAV